MLFPMIPKPSKYLEGMMLKKQANCFPYREMCSRDFHGGPLAHDLQPNKKGIILGRYLSQWGYVLTHLYHQPLSLTTYIIDHILCPRYFLPKGGTGFTLQCVKYLRLPPSPCSPHNWSWYHSSTTPMRSHATPSQYIPDWKKCNQVLTQYASMVEHALPSLPPVWSIDDINCITESLTKSLTSSASLSFLTKPFIHTSIQTGAMTLRTLNLELRRPIKHSECRVNQAMFLL